MASENSNREPIQDGQSPADKRTGPAGSLPAEVTRELDLSGLNSPTNEDPDLSSDFELASDQLQNESAHSGKLKQPVIGDYQIEGVLGKGGMGQVFRAHHRTMDRHVALKILPEAFSTKPEWVERFYSEIRAVGRLMHANIVTAFDAGQFGGIHYLVMELIEGTSLAQLVAQQGPLGTEQVVAIIAQAASALDYAHSQGIIHRDIKPSNMMLTERGILKILDFGLARFNAHAAEIEKDRQRQLMGTVEYMSPEQINAPDKVDHRSDLYSLGATMFFLLTGRPMFTGEAVQVALAHVRTKPPALYEVRGDVDLRLDSIFQKLIAKDVPDRFHTGAEVLEQMRSANLIDANRYTLEKDRSNQNRFGRLTQENPTDGIRGESTSLRKYSAIGIDLGLIESRASFIDSQFELKEVLLDGISKSLKGMLWSDGQQVKIGKSAADERAKHPSKIFYSLQRWFGLPILERPFGGRNVPPEVLVAAVIRRIVECTQIELPSVSHAVVTIPSCYDQLHRTSVTAACKIAGLEVLQLLEKHLAAALAHVEIEVELHASNPNLHYATKHLLVCSLNGEACEAAVVRVEGRRVSSLSSAGDWKRGILRWQHRLAEKLSEQFLAENNVDVRQDLSLSSRFQRYVEQAFEYLNRHEFVDIHLEAAGHKLTYKLEREGLRELGGEIADDISKFAEQAIERSGIDIQLIDEVLLVGDILKMKLFQDQITQVLGKKKKMVPISQADLARGAAIQAQYLMPPSSPKSPYAEACTVYDFALMVEGPGNRMAAPRTLIPRGTTLPTTLSKTLRFSSATIPNPHLQFVEGTRHGNLHWNRMGQVSMADVFEGRPANDPVQLHLVIDASGLWTADLTWLAKNQSVSIPPLTIPTMDVVNIRQWKDWLETLMLVNVDPVE